jgi:sugar-specific transcriptional regulator TrmB
MTTDDEFTRRLIGFGLSEKEAQLYLHLLKYGPKTPSPLAKSLKTYREDVHRTLTGLIEKGMVRPSLDSPTIYAAVDLDSALESAVKKQESELREMEARKRELQELAKQQQFRPSDEVATFKIIKSLKELLTTMLPIGPRWRRSGCALFLHKQQ